MRNLKKIFDILADPTRYCWVAGNTGKVTYPFVNIIKSSKTRGLFIVQTTTNSFYVDLPGDKTDLDRVVKAKHA